MTNIILNGCNGKMGQAISALAAADPDVCIIAGFDVTQERKNDYPVYTSPADFEGNADVVIDFSHPSALTAILTFCRERSLPVVVATTGLSDGQKNEMLAASEHIPVFFSANMSLGVNLLIELCKRAAKILEGSFDIEIIEKHHNQKIDAPSGTALAIADAINDAVDMNTEYVYDRHAQRRKRKTNEIGIHAVRGGTIVGEHSVIFAGKDEVIEIKHSAASRELFATGAVKAAKFMHGKTAGMYSMSDLFS